jgi:hypothetical protein
MTRTTIKWNKDAENGLSYSKMKHVLSLRHPRKVVKGERKSLSWCGSSTGWHCCCKRMRNSDIRDLGVGISVYFKFLKFIICLYLWFAILSLPAYLLYYSGNETGTQYKSIKYVLSAFSLGNIG